MKRLLFILLCILSMPLASYSQNYYWYDNKKIYLENGTQRYVVYQESNLKNKNALRFVQNGYLSPKDNNLKWGIISSKDTLSVNRPFYQISSFRSTDGSREIYVTHRFYVKLGRIEDYALLDSLSNQYNVTIEETEGLPLWHVLNCGYQTTYNALELANIFYESGLFEASEPEITNAIFMDCVNDPKFSMQWNLKNWGQNFLSDGGVDIHYCDAHSITSGDTSIIIGVYDRGIDLTHPDINIHSFSYDVNNLSSPSQLYHYHGTACAGIISAKTNNGIGVAGIAPECPVMSISFESTSYYNIGLGFKKAADKGCSVISNSWHLGTPSQYVDDGISYALSTGRSGRGCVVVFSAGNENRDSVNYPANSNDDIIVVGAISPCGERCNPYSCDAETWWGSNYGEKLDVMAPGVNIPTTDIVGGDGKDTSSYMMDFNGTSSACPHVAAIAGLILSVNPYLSQTEVSDIIESTAQKIGVGFANNSNRPNGTWSSWFGYGLVDAYAAVLAAKDRHPIQGPDYYCDTTCFYFNNASDALTYTWSATLASAIRGHFNIISGQGTPEVCVKHVIPMPFPGLLLSSLDKMGGFNHIDFNLPTSISVTVSDGNSVQTYKKILRNPIGSKPIVSVSADSYNWPLGTTRIFNVTNCSDEPDDVFLWVVKQGSTIKSTGVGKTFEYKPTVSGPYTVYVTNMEKECGKDTTSLSYYVSRGITLNAIEEGEVLNISVIEENEKNDANYIIELWSSIYGCMYTKPTTSSRIQVDTTNFPNGVYVLLLKENDNVVAETKVLIQ